MTVRSPNNSNEKHVLNVDQPHDCSEDATQQHAIFTEQAR